MNGTNKDCTPECRHIEPVSDFTTDTPLNWRY